MTKEELEIDNKRLDFNEKVQLVVKKEELKEQDVRLNKLCFDYQEKDRQIEELEKENAELKKNYEDSLVACGVLKNKVELLAQPSPLESMQDVLIATQKAQNEKQSDQLIKAIKLLKETQGYIENNDDELYDKIEQFLKEIEKCQFQKQH